jgi:spermidine synthase
MTAGSNGKAETASVDTREARSLHSRRVNKNSAASFKLIFLCFFLSGATGLIYQVIWLRMLGLVFGHSVYAITTVLAAFMAGLALGSFVFARRTTRIRNLVGAYGWLEIAIGISCALVPVLLWAAAEVYIALHRVFALSYDTFSLVQFLLVFLLLLFPTTLMGGTLPVLSQALVKQDLGLGRKVGALYAVNTFGAVAGVVLAGYVLLPAYGNYLTIAIAVTGNLLVGCLALIYSRRTPSGQTPGEAVTRQGNLRPRADRLPLAARLTVIALGVSGAVSMIYEVCWTRAISLVIGSSTYAFTAMLVAFLVGIAGGSGLYSWLAGSRRPAVTVFALLQAGIGIMSALTLLFFERIPELFLRFVETAMSLPFIQFAHFVVSAASLLPFTLLIGATFPCAVALVAHKAARVGEEVGNIYAVNTLGCILGSVLGGFILIPMVGINGSVKIGIAVNLLVAAVLLAPMARPEIHGTVRQQALRWGRVTIALGMAVGALFLPAWDQRVMSSGPAIYPFKYLQVAKVSSLDRALRAQEILFYRDGRSGTVSVERSGEFIILRVNGKADASTGIDMPTQLMSGHLPMLLHRQPLRVLVIGMGSGITAGAVLRHPIEQLDIVEIEPAVLEASHYFAAIHGDVLANARAHAIVADGRNYLLTTDAHYDVIISEPSNPWIAGLASLFTTEFFGLARQHLRPGGMMVQWLQGYSLFTDDFRMIVNTFRSVFPSVSVWSTHVGDYLLIGATEPEPVDLLRLKERYLNSPKIHKDMHRLKFTGWGAPLGYFVLSDQDTARLADGAGLNTDHRLSLEFSAPRALYADTAGANLNLVRSYQTMLVPPITRESGAELRQPLPWYTMGMVRLERNSYREALTLFERALQIEPGYVAAQVGAAWAHLKMGDPTTALRLAQDALLRQSDNSDALYVAGMASEQRTRFQDMVEYLQRALAVNPEGNSQHYYNRRILYHNLGLAYAKAHRYTEAETAFRQAIDLAPYDASIHNSLSRLLIELGRPEEAVAAADESLRHDPTHLWAHFNRAWALEKLGRFDEASRSYEKALLLDPSLDEVKLRLLALKDSVIRSGKTRQPEVFNPGAIRTGS